MKKDTPAPRKARPAGKAAGSTRTRRDAALQAAAAEPPATSDMALPAESPPKPMARVPMKVRWGDLDAFNHVNNATFLVYAQEARLEWLAGIEGTWFDDSMMPVVAAANVNFRRQLSWPARIVAELAASRLGTSSVTITHRILAEDDAGCLYADGEVVMVWIDPASGRPVPLPECIRSACGGSAGTADVP